MLQEIADAKWNEILDNLRPVLSQIGTITNDTGIVTDKGEWGHRWRIGVND